MTRLNLKNCRILGWFLLLGVLFTGCGGSGHDNDAIRSAINSHLAARGNLNMSAFDTEVQKIAVKGDSATADVAFHVKGGPGVMQLTYNLKKTGGAWAVIETNPIGITPAAPGGSTAPGSASGAPSTDIIDSLRQKMAAPATTPTK